MTLRDKIRIYELSRDLNLENKDILDAAQKLSISVKSHSSSISLEDAKKIKNLIKSNVSKSKNIISVNKSSLKSNPQKNLVKDVEEISKNYKTNVNSRNKNPKAVKLSKPLLTKPSISKFTGKDKNSKIENLNPPQIISTSKPLNEQKNNSSFSNNNQYEIKVKSQNKATNKIDQLPKAPKPPIQLIDKPKNINRPQTQNIQTNPNKQFNTNYTNLSLIHI